MDFSGRPSAIGECIGNTERGPVPCCKRVDCVRDSRSEEKYTEGADHRANTCMPILEITPHTFQYYNHHSEAGVWMSIRDILLLPLKYVLYINGFVSEVFS